jgi:predicted negative regulator of RcsB-dependent stress response
MTETFVSMVAMMVALLAAFGTAIIITAALIAWQDWQRQRASSNCEAGRSHRMEGIRQHLKPRF